MKKLVALLAAMLLVLAVSASTAEELSGLTDQELITLHQEVLDEMARRGISYMEDPTEDEEIVRRVHEFMDCWNRNSLDEMLKICDSEWKTEAGNPRTELFAILANRTPLSYTLEKLEGSEGDALRTAEITALMDRHNYKDPVSLHFSIILKMEEDGQWYVEPMSLQTCEYTQDPATPEPGPTAEPAEAPAEITGETVLYYLPLGGAYYHLDPECKSVNPRYRPMEGTFLYAEVNDEAYRELKPCEICGAPARNE